MSCELKSNNELDIEERDKEIDRLERKCARLRQELEELTTAVENECKHDTVLREAIETHRRNVWGDGCEVGRYEDEKLYAALQDAEG